MVSGVSLILRMVDGQGEFQRGLELPAVLRHEDHPIICLLLHWLCLTELVDQGFRSNMEIDFVKQQADHSTDTPELILLHDAAGLDVD